MKRQYVFAVNFNETPVIREVPFKEMDFPQSVYDKMEEELILTNTETFNSFTTCFFEESPILGYIYTSRNQVEIDVALDAVKDSLIKKGYDLAEGEV